MAVEAIMSVVIQKLTDMLTEESVTLGQVIDQLKEMREKLNEMRGYLTDAENKLESDQKVKEWARKYLLILYKVEDMIETFALGLARQRKRFGFLIKYAFFLKNLNTFSKLRRRMNKIKCQIQSLNQDRPVEVEDISLKLFSSLPGQNREGITLSGGEYLDEKVITAAVSVAFQENQVEDGEETMSDSDNEIMQEGHARREALLDQRLVGSAISVPHKQHFPASRCQSLIGERLQQPRLMSSNTYKEEELGLMALRQDVRKLVKRLMKKGDRVVSIVGAVGSGKTTLARAIHRSRDIKKWFKRRPWVLISKDFDKKDLLLNLLEQLGDSKVQVARFPEEVLKDRIKERLQEERYLIILDNVCDHDVWEELKEVFPETRNGSKIILTTSDLSIAKSADPNSLPHRLEALSKKVSWKMFSIKVALEESADLIPEMLKPKILEMCNGLPLNIVLLGGLLSTKKEVAYSEWDRVLSSQKVWTTSDILSLCYNDLPDLSKLCLLYLVLFPKEYDIPVRRLLRLWLAEGFVKRPEDDNVPEDVVQKCFDDLGNRSLIQITKLRSDGSPRRCRLLGVLHDYLLPRAREISLFYVHRKLDDKETAAADAAAAAEQFGVRRIVEYADIKNFSLKPSQLGRLRSYLSFNFQRKDTPAKEVGRFVSRILDSGFGLLRVLDLEGVYKPSLPENLGDLFHLRYLSLRWTFLDSIPESVGDLLYLETLDVKHTNINSLPSSVWKLQHLRHLNLNEIRLDMPKKALSSLPKILTLWGLFVDDKSPLDNGLNKLCDLRELGITFHLTSSQDLLVDWIANLDALQSLRVRSKDDGGRPSKLMFKSLGRLSKLSHLNMLGHLQKLPEKNEFPPNIKVLTLSVSYLKEDPMPILGQLGSLKVLRLLADSYLGKTMVCPQGGFGKLRVLKLWMLRALEDWDVEKGAMQNLKELNIRCCKKLKHIPSDLLQREYPLEEVTLTSMEEPFITDVERRKTARTLLTHNHLEFTSLPWEGQDHTY